MNYVYIVLELSEDAKIHGVYSTREIAENVAFKCQFKPGSGYVCVLKKRVKGPKGGGK